MSGPTERKKGIQIHRGIVYGSHARLLTAEEAKLATPGHTHRWTVFLQSATTPPPTFKTTSSSTSTGTGGVGKGKGKGKTTPKLEEDARNELEVQDENDDFITGGADDLSWLIKRVTFRLHETYPSPNRPVDKPPYRITETGWGEFPLNIRVQFQQETGEKTIGFAHQLRLHHWGPPAVGPLQQQQQQGQGQGQGQGDNDAGVGPGVDGSMESKGEQVGGTMSQAGEALGNSRAGTPAAGQVSTPKSGIQGSVGDADVDAEGEEEDVGVPTPGGADVPDLGNSNANANSNADDGQDVQMKNVDEVKPEPMDSADDGQLAVVSEPMTGIENDGGTNDDPQEGGPMTGSSTSSGPPTINPLPVHSWQYDQFVFTDPTTTLYQLLLAHPETPLPRRSIRKGQDPGRGAILGVDRGSAGVPLEFTEELELAERERLENARRSLVEETDRWRQRLIELESEAQRLKDQIAAV